MRAGPFRPAMSRYPPDFLFVDCKSQSTLPVFQMVGVWLASMNSYLELPAQRQNLKMSKLTTRHTSL